MIIKRIFLCIGIVIWSLLIHFAPFGGERGIFGKAMLAIVFFGLMIEIATIWREA